MSGSVAARILLVEDEPQMLDICEFILTGSGYSVTGVLDAETAERRIRQEHFDLLLCDIMLPGESGLSLCRRVRESTDIPVCFLSAKGTPEERVAGFEAGADEYIVKPFNARELLMRVAVILRHNLPSSQQINGPLIMTEGSIAVRVGTRRVNLSDVESRLLAALFAHLGQPVGWQELVAAGWLTSTPETGRDMLKTTIRRLRGKLGPTDPQLIVSVRGEGYLMPDLDDTVGSSGE